MDSSTDDSCVTQVQSEHVDFMTRCMDTDSTGYTGIGVADAGGSCNDQLGSESQVLETDCSRHSK